MKKILELEDEIKKIIEEETKEISLTKMDPEEEKEVLDKMQIFVGGLPREDLDTLAPCAIVTTLKGQNNLQEKRLNTVVSIAIYNKDTRKGYEEICELIEKITEAIVEKGVLLDEFEILPDYSWALPEVQPYPIHGADITFNILARNDYRRDADIWED